MDQGGIRSAMTRERPFQRGNVHKMTNTKMGNVANNKIGWFCTNVDKSTNDLAVLFQTKFGTASTIGGTI